MKCRNRMRKWKEEETKRNAGGKNLERRGEKPQMMRGLKKKR